MKINQPKITPSQLSLFTEPVTDIYQALEFDVFNMIAKRLRTSTDITADTVLEWQVDKMNQLRMVNNDTIRSLSATTGIAEREIRNAIKGTGVVTINSVDHELKNIYAPIPIPSDIDRTLEKFVTGTFREFDNYINQSLISTNYGTGTVTDMYRKIIEQTTGKVLAGTKTVNQAVTETVVGWARSGLNTGFVDKGGHTWDLARYSEMITRTTANSIYNDIRMERMKEYGVNLVIVSSLPDPREICSHIQGRVASTLPQGENYSEYPSIYEYGYETPSGLRGINCRHQFFPYIEGVNTNNQREYSEDEMTENREARQKQRYHERQIRSSKRDLKLAETIGDEGSIGKYKNIVGNRQSKIRDHITETGRTRQYFKEKVEF